jgi:hypothetical protein
MADSGIHWTPIGSKPPAKACSLFSKTPSPDPRESVICLPPFPMKSDITRKLVSTKNVILIDLDSFIKTINEKELLSQIEDAERSENNGLHHILYSMAASKALDFVRREISKDPKMSAIFVTSDYEWSTRNFAPHRLYVAIPSRDLHHKIIESSTPDERDKVDRIRTEFISRLSYDSVRTFNTYDELESMIRSRFGIQHKH